MGKYLLGIDNGSTVSKAALFDLHGKEIAVASCKADTEYPHPGWTERGMEMLWQSTASAIREVIAKSGAKPTEIAGIGNTGHVDTECRHAFFQIRIAWSLLFKGVDSAPDHDHRRPDDIPRFAQKAYRYRSLAGAPTKRHLHALQGWVEIARRFMKIFL